MKLKLVVCILFVAFSAMFLQYAFSEYANLEYTDLIGKEVEIHGPYGWEMIGVATTQRAFDDLVYAYRMRDNHAFSKILKSYDVLRIAKNTKAFVVDIQIFKSRAHIVIMNGLYKGMSGYIPIEWLSGNSGHIKL